MKIALTITFFVIAYLSVQVVLSYQQEEAREALENDKYCEAFQILKWTSRLTKEGKRGLARLYSGGLCVDQNIEMAKKLYGSINDELPEEIGKEFFYAALETADADERMNQKKRDLIIKKLFMESVKLGFQPDDRDFSNLEESGLKIDYINTRGNGSSIGN